MPDNDVSLARGFAVTGNPVDGMDAGTRWYLRSEVEDEYAAAADQLSLWYFWEDGEFGGQDAMFPERVRTTGRRPGRGSRCPAGRRGDTRGSWGLRVQVHAADGTVYTAERAIVTVPIPLLREMSFNPVLSAKQRAALASLGMGLMDKVALRFPKRAWPKGPDYFGLAHNPISPVAEWWKPHQGHRQAGSGRTDRWSRRGLGRGERRCDRCRPRDEGPATTDELALAGS